jgi:hypothetical protein
MADPRLTWRNIEAPDLSRAAQILNAAASNWSSGFNNAGDALFDARQRQKEKRSAEAIPMLAGVTGEGDFNNVLAQLANMNPADMTPELQAALLSGRAGALGLDQTRQQMDIARKASDRAGSGAGKAAADEAANAAAILSIFGENPSAAAAGAGERAGASTEAASSEVVSPESLVRLSSKSGSSTGTTGAAATVTTPVALAGATPPVTVEAPVVPAVSAVAPGLVATANPFNLVRDLTAAGIKPTEAVKFVSDFQELAGNDIGNQTALFELAVRQQDRAEKKADEAELEKSIQKVNDTFERITSNNAFNSAEDIPEFLDNPKARIDVGQNDLNKDEKDALRSQLTAYTESNPNTLNMKSMRTVQALYDTKPTNVITKDDFIELAQRNMGGAELRQLMPAIDQFFNDNPNAAPRVDGEVLPQYTGALNQLEQLTQVSSAQFDAAQKITNTYNKDTRDVAGSTNIGAAVNEAADSTEEGRLPESPTSNEGEPASIRSIYESTIDADYRKPMENGKAPIPFYEFQTEVDRVIKEYPQLKGNPILAAEIVGESARPYQGLGGTVRVNWNREEQKALIADRASYGSATDANVKVESQKNIQKRFAENNTKINEIVSRMKLLAQVDSPEAAKEFQALNAEAILLAQENAMLPDQLAATDPNVKAQLEADAAAELQAQMNAATAEAQRTAAMQGSAGDAQTAERVSAEMARLAGERTPTPDGFVVDPEASAVRQWWQRGRREQNIENNLERVQRILAKQGATGSLTTSLDVMGPVDSALSGFTDTPAEVAAGDVRRDKLNKVSDWYSSEEALAYFDRYPDKLQEALDSPAEFYEKFMKQRKRKP